MVRNFIPANTLCLTFDARAVIVRS